MNICYANMILHGKKVTAHLRWAGSLGRTQVDRNTQLYSSLKQSEQKLANRKFLKIFSNLL